MHYNLPSASFKRLYVQLVKPVITYASPAWWSDSPAIYLKNRLKSLQHLPLLAMTGAVQKTTTEALNALTGIPPICEKLNALWAQFVVFHLRRTVTCGKIAVKPDEVQLSSLCRRLWNWRTAWHACVHRWRFLATVGRRGFCCI